MSALEDSDRYNSPQLWSLALLMTPAGVLAASAAVGAAAAADGDGVVAALLGGWEKGGAATRVGEQPFIVHLP